MALARCPKCEAIIDSNDVYCRYCGCKIKEEPKDAKVDSFSAENSASKKENVTPSSTSFTNKKPYTTSTSSSNHVSSAERPYHPHENKYKYYDENKLARIRFGYVLSFIMVIFLGLIGAYLISTSLDNKIDYKIDSTLMSIGICICFVAFVIFIITLVKLVKSYEDPVETCINEEVSNIDVEDVVDVGIDLLDIIINK